MALLLMSCPGAVDEVNERLGNRACDVWGWVKAVELEVHNEVRLGHKLAPCAAFAFTYEQLLLCCSFDAQAADACAGTCCVHSTG